jgi:hypothetical protein
MPTRANAIVVCSCGVKFGRVDRAAACEDMAAVEHALIAAEVPRMVRHFELQHTLSLGPNAPREFLGVVAEAARRVAAARERGLPPVEDQHDD